MLGGVTREPARMPALPGHRNGWPGLAPPRLGVGPPASLPACAWSLIEDHGAQQHPPADEPAEVRPPSACVAVCALLAATWQDKAFAAP